MIKKLILYLIFLLALSSSAYAATATYTGQGSFVQASYTQNGITVEGSSNVNVNNLNGLGIVGGSSDLYINTGESVTFTFGTKIATDFSLTKGGVGNGDGDGNFPEADVEAFDASGVSLGVVRFNSVPNSTDMLSSFGSVPISKITLSPADGDTFNITTVTATLINPPVTTPAASIPDLAKAATYIISHTSQISVSGYSNMVFDTMDQKNSAHIFDAFKLSQLALNYAKNTLTSTPFVKVISFITSLIDKPFLLQFANTDTDWLNVNPEKFEIDKSLWFSTKFHSFKETTQGANFDGDLSQYMLGKDLWTIKNIRTGLALGLESLNTSTNFNNGSLDGFGVSIVPYFNWHIFHQTDIRGMFGFSVMNYDIYSSSSQSDFDTLRYFPSLALLHKQNFGNLSISPFSQVEYFSEQGRDDITDNLGNKFNFEKINGGSMKVGTKAAYALLVSKDLHLDITGSYNHEFYFDWQKNGALGDGTYYGRNDGADNFELGMCFVNSSGLGGRLQAGYSSDYDDFKSWNINLEITFAQW